MGPVATGSWYSSPWLTAMAGGKVGWSCLPVLGFANSEANQVDCVVLVTHGVPWAALGRVASRTIL